jgi:hypothetical protein
MGKEGLRALEGIENAAANGLDASLHKLPPDPDRLPGSDLSSIGPSQSASQINLPTSPLSVPTDPPTPCVICRFVTYLADFTRICITECRRAWPARLLLYHDPPPHSPFHRHPPSPSKSLPPMRSRTLHYHLLLRSTRNLRTWSKAPARKIRVLSRSLKTFDSRPPRPPRPVVTLHAVFPYGLHALAREAVAIRQAAVREQVRGHSASRPRLRSHLPAVRYRFRRLSTSAKAAAGFSAALPGCSVAVAVSAGAIFTAPRSGRRARRRICGPHVATWTPTAKMRLLLSHLPVDFSVDVRMTHHRRRRHHIHRPQHQRSSESASHRKRRRIKGGSAMALQLEVEVRVRDLPENVRPY